MYSNVYGKSRKRSMIMMESSETVTLYHGLKSGICNYPKAKIYTLSVDLSNLKILDIEIGLE